MSWQDENKIKRIFNTFKRVKANIFNEDIEALKYISERLEENQKLVSDNNILFCKLLAIQLKHNLEHFSSIKTAIKVLDSELKQPLSFHLAILQTSLNNTDKINYFKSLGFDMDAHTNEDLKIKENEKQIIEALNKNWSYENVSKSFYKSANDFITDINNYVL